MTKQIIIMDRMNGDHDFYKTLLKDIVTLRGIEVLCIDDIDSLKEKINLTFSKTSKPVLSEELISEILNVTKPTYIELPESELKAKLKSDNHSIKPKDSRYIGNNSYTNKTSKINYFQRRK